jgi:hypothetical protein
MKSQATKKIFFAPTPWSSSAEVANDYKLQTPNAAGIWKDIEYTDNAHEADFLIIQDECFDLDLLNKFDRLHKLYFNREALSTHLIKSYSSEQFNRFSFWDGSGYLPVRWRYDSELAKNPVGYGGIALTYDELVDLKPMVKNRKICAVVSNKKSIEGHKLRRRFVKKFIKKVDLDLYGTISIRNMEMPENNKFEVLKEYKYSLGFDNQDSIDDFIGTQFTDSILSWTIPIFWCGTDLGKYFPENSFLQFDARDSSEIDRISHFLQEDNYEDRLNDLAEARDLILNKYNLWPTIKSVIDRV